MYQSDHDMSTDSGQKLPDLQLYVLAALDAEVSGQPAEPDERTPLYCASCGCHDIALIGSGVQMGDAVTIIAGDGIHILRGVPGHPLGPAIITLIRCSAGHVCVEYARSIGERVYRGCEVYPVASADLPDMKGGQPSC